MMSMMRTMLFRMVNLAAAIAGMLALSRPAQAQGCALCYASVSAAGAAAQEALRSGILALLIPVLLLMIAVAVLVWRRRGSPETTL
jgi:hypothetical protein